MFKKIKNHLKLILTSTVLILLANPSKVLAVQLINPLSGKAEGLAPSELYGRIIAGFLGIIGATALIAFIWGGFLWLTSGGNPEKIKKGRDTLVWAIIGLIIVFGSYIILSYIITTITGAAGTKT